MLSSKKVFPIQILIVVLFYFSDISPINAQNKTDDWWRKTTVYQIYPRSFYDSDGDGLGDLNGIIQKLDYIKDLGVETIWISPFFLSPQKDFGYDISDYFSIAPEYGTMSICDQLIQEIHKRNMRVIFDLVMNHTSDAHSWFQESASSDFNAKADWYVWKNGKGKKGRRKPNNWKSMVGGSGWHYNNARKQFYWASFLPFQPDLNYRNPEVKKNMLDVTRFWTEKGVDGFRLDIFSSIYEDSTFRNNPFSFKPLPDEKDPDGFFQIAKYNINCPESFEFATELRKTVNKTGNKYLVGEVFGEHSILKQYCYYHGKLGLSSVFLFETLNTPLNATTYRKLVSSFEKDFPAPFLPTYVYGNHDRRRSISRLKNNIQKAKLLALLQYTVRGIPYTYYGEELGIPQSNIPLKKGKDPMADRLKWIPQFLADLSSEAINRDGCRTPMLWNGDKKAGFTTAINPWLPVTENCSNLTVHQQMADSTSLLNFYKSLLAFRKSVPALHSGSLTIAEEFCDHDVFAYYRIYENEKYLVVLNMSKLIKKTILPKGKVIFTLNAENNEIKAFGGIVMRIE